MSLVLVCLSPSIQVCGLFSCIRCITLRSTQNRKHNYSPLHVKRALFKRSGESGGETTQRRGKTVCVWIIRAPPLQTRWFVIYLYIFVLYIYILMFHPPVPEEKHIVLPGWVFS